MNFSKLLVSLKSNLKLQIYEHERQNKNCKFSYRVSNENLSFCVQKQCLEICQCPGNLPKSSLNLPNRRKKSNWSKKAKKTNFIWPFFKNKKRSKELKKGPKLQIWPQKSQTRNLFCTRNLSTELLSRMNSVPMPW